jgi:hypothetical protein
MKTFEELAEYIAEHQRYDEAIQECHDAIARNHARPLGQQSWGLAGGRASSALSILQIREWTTRTAGISTLGFQGALSNLAALPPDEKILQYSIEAPDKSYIILVTEAHGEYVGCIQVKRRLGDGLSVERQYRKQCPCCGYYTLSRRGQYDKCPICFWEDEDPADDFNQPAREKQTSVYVVPLEEARRNFVAFGAAEERYKSYVRPPEEGELR